MPTIDKIPIVDGFGAENPDFTCGREWFGEPGAQVAVLCGPCPALAPDHLLVIDIDGGIEDNAPMQAFLDTLPSTMSSHGGRHLFFRVAPEQVGRLGQWGLFKRPGRKHDGLDLRWAGGYVRETWSWSAPADALIAAIAVLPGAALAAIQALRGADTPAGGARAPQAPLEDRGDAYLSERGFDPLQVRQDAIRWLQERAPLPEDGTGGATLLVVCGALLVGFGLDDELALELLCDVYAPRAWPDEDPDVEGFERKLDEIDRLGSERFEELELACLGRTVRQGMALTAPPPPIAAVLADARAGAAIEQRADSGVAPLARAYTDDEYLSTWRARMKYTAKGEPINLAVNTALTLDLHPTWRGMFGYDEFTHNVVFLRGSTDIHLQGFTAGDVFNEDLHPTALQVWFGWNCHEPSISAIIAGVHASARQRPFHAVRQYLEGLRGTWDGVDRNLSEYLGAEQTPYHRAVCAKWMRAAVARAMKPGCKADTMLILEGKQGWKKSTALKSLCPDVRWFFEAASREVGSKDFMQDMAGKWLCEIPEVDQLIRSRDESELKAFLSRTSDNYRASYARKSVDHPRQLVPAGTTNEDDYLRDPTGNRRYWPVPCGVTGPILDGGICDDRGQLWAQAVTEYDAGAIWWLDDPERIAAEDEQAARLGQDPWFDAMSVWVAERKLEAEPFSTTDVLGHLPGAKPVADMTPADITRAGKALRQMGCKQVRPLVGGRKLRMWLPPD